MTHPFGKIFESALRKSTEEDNLVAHEAEKLLEKGYSEGEIRGVLEQLRASLIEDADAAIVEEAIDACFEG